MAISTINSGHFDGHKNLNAGQRRFADAILEELLAEMAAILDAGTLAPTLTVGTEAADVIAVTFAGPAAVRQYMAEAIDPATMEVNAAAFTLAETGDGAEVSPTDMARLIFTTDAAGAAEISITDVAGASAKTMWLVIRPINDSASDAPGAAGVVVSATFD
jgi:hypothetical protein